MEYVQIELPVRDWQLVDACADNSASTDVVDLDIGSVTTSACVRDAGWRASAAFADEHDALGWPPADRMLAILLQREHWRWVVAQLDRWARLEDGADLERLRAAIEERLA
ncbi:hypothetical protein [Agrococcus sp. TF02-05]|uniref:hypothetical protein n=1 Tax=Agrococcus sp. TF02-05 TaxID=2815211 RepID=UPI001AA12091|nr:hypothetical protein [Agrococcus sp. TF02-05]MBO1769379.1 hypothetical protein [Agrococcus sp. TF02-05]